MVTYLYRCDEQHDNLRPGQLGVTPPATVSCEVCLREARRVWAVPEVNVVGGTGGGKRPRPRPRKPRAWTPNGDKP